MATKLKKVNNAQIIKDDEFYTLREEVEYLLSTLPVDYLKDKIVYSPCDSELSEFVKYIKSHKDELKYKEYIYTSDDLFTHKDLFELCDIVITNPPFSIENKIIEFIYSLKKVPKIHLVGGAVNTAIFFIFHHPEIYVYRYKCYGYIRPNGETKKFPFSTLITNVENCRNIINYDLHLKNEITKEIYLDLFYRNEKVLECKYLRNIPKNYKGYMAVPITILYQNVFDRNDLIFLDIGKKHKFKHSENYFPLLYDTYTINNKTTFFRFIIKWKKFSTEEDLKLFPKKLKSEPLF